MIRNMLRGLAVVVALSFLALVMLTAGAPAKKPAAPADAGVTDAGRATAPNVKAEPMFLPATKAAIMPRPPPPQQTQQKP
jgi:hypothetical protein